MDAQRELQYGDLFTAWILIGQVATQKPGYVKWRLYERPIDETRPNGSLCPPRASTVGVCYNHSSAHNGWGDGMATTRIDLSNQKFGRLLVVRQGGRRGRKTTWECKCSCGNLTTVVTDNLRSGKTGSCGCRKSEAARENCLAHGIKPRHGMTGTGVHNSWASMIERCRGQGSGGRYKRLGIEVCKRWEIFENFYEDMGDRPDGMTIDRIDCSLGYFKENCKWSTATEQQRNRTNSRYLLIEGKKVPLMELAESIGIKKNAAQYFFSVLRLLQNKNIRAEVYRG